MVYDITIIVPSHLENQTPLIFHSTSELCIDNELNKTELDKLICCERTKVFIQFSSFFETVYTV